MANDEVVFGIKVRMKKRWVPHFISMLRYMQLLGNAGSSRRVTLYADGDGDFRPKFEFVLVSEEDLAEVEPVKDENGDRTYDAG